MWFHGLCEDSVPVKPVKMQISTCCHVDMNMKQLVNPWNVTELSTVGVNVIILASTFESNKQTKTKQSTNNVDLR